MIAKRAEKEVIENTESSYINLNLSADSNHSLIDAELYEIIRKATSNENDDQIELNEFDESQLAYLACVCHLLQLAINDAFKVVKYFYTLVKKISHFISKLVNIK